jgi:hypothetical protein
MLRRQPSLIDQSSLSITILPNFSSTSSNSNSSSPSQDRRLTSMLSQQRRDSTKPMIQHRPTSRLHEPDAGMVGSASSSRTEQEILPAESTILTSLAEEWIKDGSPIQKFGAMLQRPFRKDKKDFIATTLQRKGTGGCISVDYAQCHESVFAHFLEQSSGNAAKSFLYPFLMDHHANLLALFGDSVVTAVETSAPTTHPLQTRKTKLAKDIMDKETRRMAHKNRASGDISWSKFSTSTGILQSFGF